MPELRKNWCWGRTAPQIPPKNDLFTHVRAAEVRVIRFVEVDRCFPRGRICCDSGERGTQR